MWLHSRYENKIPDWKSRAWSGHNSHWRRTEGEEGGLTGGGWVALSLSVLSRTGSGSGLGSGPRLALSPEPRPASQTEEYLSHLSSSCHFPVSFFWWHKLSQYELSCDHGDPVRACVRQDPSIGGRAEGRVCWVLSVGANTEHMWSPSQARCDGEREESSPASCSSDLSLVNTQHSTSRGKDHVLN